MTTNTKHQVELLIWIHMYSVLRSVSPSVSHCLFVCYCSWCVMRLTNTASATWHTAQGTFKASLRLHPGIACMHALALRHTDVHTNGFSRTHFVKLNGSASADDRTQAAVTGDDHVACVFAHQRAPLNTWRSRPARFGAPDVAALHRRPPTPWFIPGSYGAPSTYIRRARRNVYTHLCMQRMHNRTHQTVILGRTHTLTGTLK